MAMKTSICIEAVLVIHLVLSLLVLAGNVPKSNDGDEVMMMMRRGDTVEVVVAGSSLPDCSHACGSCSPCRLVMVSFVCASLAEAETCPVSYKCMCNAKSYPVP